MEIARDVDCSIEALVRGHPSRFDARTLVNVARESFLSHENRFVREAGYMLCDALAASCAQNGDDVAGGSSNLAQGLSDNWSQVRYAASIATRTVVLSPSSAREDVLSVLVPRMLLNRHYLAQGVQLYSRETWRLAFGERGRNVAAAHLGAVVAFYVSQAEADNHAVREATCHCAAELATNLSPDVLEPHVGDLVGALLACFRDESWTVRDAFLRSVRSSRSR